MACQPLWRPARAFRPFDGSSELSADGLTVYFDSGRDGDRGIYTATRETTSSGFGPPVLIEVLSADGNAEDPTISADGRTLIFSSSRAGERRLYQSKR